MMDAKARRCPSKLVRLFVLYLKYQRHFSEKTGDSYTSDLRHFGDWLLNSRSPAAQNSGRLRGELDDLDLRFLGANRQIVEAYLTDVVEKWQASTARRYAATLRSFYQWLLSEQAIAADPMSEIRTPVAEPERRALILASAEVQRLMAAPGESIQDRIDLLLMLLVYETLAFLDELLLIKLADLHLSEPAAITVGSLNKGRRRSLIIPNDLSQAILAYLRERSSWLEQNRRQGGYLILSTNNPGKQVNSQLIRRNLKKHLRKAGLADKITFQSLRVSGIAAKLKPLSGKPEETMTVKQIVKTYRVAVKLVKWTEAQLAVVNDTGVGR